MIGGLLMRVALDGFGGVSEALYPTNDLGAPDWQDTEMVERAAQWWGELPPQTRHLLQLAFGAVELSAPLLVGGFGRFSRMPVQRRLKAMARWHSSRLWVFRTLADSLKSATTLMYLSHPLALRYLGAGPGCEPTDASRVTPGRLEVASAPTRPA